MTLVVQMLHVSTHAWLLGPSTEPLPEAARHRGITPSHVEGGDGAAKTAQALEGDQGRRASTLKFAQACCGWGHAIPLQLLQRYCAVRLETEGTVVALALICSGCGSFVRACVGYRRRLCRRVVSFGSCGS